MAAERRLTDLARIGFVDLSLARDELTRRGFDAEWFAVAASPDKALRWLGRAVAEEVQKEAAKRAGGAKP